MQMQLKNGKDDSHMYRSPLILGHCQYSVNDPDDVLNSTSFVGDNTGNIWFAESLFRNLRNSKRCKYDFKARDVNGCDVIVISAANWIYQYVDIGDMCDEIEKTNLPVIIVGIGAQSDHGELPAPHPSVVRLLNIARDSGSLISTRGEYTTRVLNEMGFDNCVTTGCPSMLMYHSSNNCDELYDLEAKDVCLSGTRHFYYPPSDGQAKIYKSAISNGLDIIFQSETLDMLISKNLPLPDSYEHERFGTLKLSYQLGSNFSNDDLCEYLRLHGKFFYSTLEWESFLWGKRFLLGSRIHGAVAALISGIRTVLITHDERTRELALSLNIPHINISDVGDLSFDEIINIYKNANHSITKIGIEEYRNKFSEFFSANNLDHLVRRL